MRFTRYAVAGISAKNTIWEMRADVSFVCAWSTLAINIMLNVLIIMMLWGAVIIRRGGLMAHALHLLRDGGEGTGDVLNNRVYAGYLRLFYRIMNIPCCYICGRRVEPRRKYCERCRRIKRTMGG